MKLPYYVYKKIILQSVDCNDFNNASPSSNKTTNKKKLDFINKKNSQRQRKLFPIHISFSFLP